MPFFEMATMVDSLSQNLKQCSWAALSAQREFGPPQAELLAMQRLAFVLHGTCVERRNAQLQLSGWLPVVQDSKLARREW